MSQTMPEQLCHRSALAVRA